MLSSKESDDLPSVPQPCSKPLPIDPVAISNGDLEKAAPGPGQSFDAVHNVQITPASNHRQRYSGLGGQRGSSARRGLQEVLTILIGRVGASLPGFVKTFSGPPLPSAPSAEKE